MNEHLNIPKDIQKLINEIENIDLNFAELPMPEHPKLPQFNRSIRVFNIDVKSKNEFMFFVYEQVLRDKDTGEEISIPLPAPEWVVYKEDWSFLRDDKNIPIDLPLKEDITQKDTVRVPSYKYMLWLLKNQKARFLELIKVYLQSFVDHNLEELNKL